MSRELDQAKRLASDAETLLGLAHEAAADARDNAEPGSSLKSDARRIGQRIEKALQQLERITPTG